MSCLFENLRDLEFPNDLWQQFEFEFFFHLKECQTIVRWGEGISTDGVLFIQQRLCSGRIAGWATLDHQSGKFKHLTCQSKGFSNEWVNKNSVHPSSLACSEISQCKAIFTHLFFSFFPSWLQDQEPTDHETVSHLASLCSSDLPGGLGYLWVSAAH